MTPWAACWPRLIFYLADNGGPTQSTTSKNDPLRGYKATTWEGGVRVPFMVQWKGKLPAGKTYDQPVIQLDILPTCVAAAGGQTSPDWKLDGVDLLPYLTGKNPDHPHETLYWRFGQQFAIRHGDWKLVRARDITAPALFNLASDIGEKNDLIASNADKATELQGIWDEWNAEQAEPKWKPDAGKAKKKGAKKGKKAKAKAKAKAVN
jgi:arylsulfatase A-like enzyme